MPRTGRPKIDAKKRKGGIFNFRVSESEQAAIEQTAAQAGKTPSAWAREIVLANVTKGNKVKQIVGGGGI